MRDFGMREVVHVGPHKLMGEIIKMEGESATIQVYEDTEGLRVNEEIVATGYKAGSTTVTAFQKLVDSVK